MDRGLDSANAPKLAEYLLRNSLVAGANLFGRVRLGAAIHREELIKLLLELATEERDKLPPEIQPLQDSLKTSLQNNVITNPAAILEAIRTTALELEKTNPELANHERMNAAILHNAASDYVAKLNAWFDQTMDRVSALFTAHARIVTAVIAILVAVVLQLDAVTLVNRLSTDDKLRETLVQHAIDHPEKYGPQSAGSPATTSLDALNASAETLKQRGLDDLLNANLIEIPTSVDDWGRRWWAADAKQAANTGLGQGQNPAGPGTAGSAYRQHMLLSKIIGVLISAALISLGAPFWYEALKNLIRLRSLVASKDEGERKERQTTQTPDGTPLLPTAARPFPASLSGEQGNLQAIG